MTASAPQVTSINGALPVSPNDQCPVLSYFASPVRLDDAEIAGQTKALVETGKLGPLLDVMPDFVMILNQNRQIIFANGNLRSFAAGRGVASVYGLRPGELLKCERVATAPAGCGTHQGCITCGAVQAILEGLEGKSAANECRISMLDGGALDLRLWASPFVWEGNHHVLLIAVDISSENRRKALERIFFHDLLNTAGGLSGMVMLLAEGIRTVDCLKDDLRHTADALITEIRSFQILAAAENHELEVIPKPLQSRQVLERAVVQSRHHPVASGKEILIARESLDFPFNSDEVLLNRVLCNLIKNALEASGPGDVVTVGAGKADHRHIFWCHNAAVMSREVQFQVFQRSFSTKGADRGLGTYGVRLLTEGYLGGKVSFESAEATGTTFRVAFPE